MNIKQRIRQITLILSISLFAFSLTQKCFCITAECVDSYIALFAGFFGFFGETWLVNLTWLANPILFMTWILMLQNTRHKKLQLTGSILSTILAVSFLLFNKIIVDDSGLREILNYKAGYWLWLTSSLVMLLGNLTIYFIESIESEEEINAS